MKKKLLGAVVFLCLFSVTANAGLVLQVNGRAYGDKNNPQSSPGMPVWLDAGQYSVELISPAEYTVAYWAWENVQGTNIWHTAFTVYVGEQKYTGGLHSAGSSKEAAFNNTVSQSLHKIEINVPTAQNVEFGVSDSILNDNWGGVSLLVTPIPEPATLSLLAFGGLALLRKRK